MSVTGRQVTVVALPLQVYLLTRSAFAVGLIGGVQLVPLIAFSLYGGAVADRMDRRMLILGSEIGLAVTSGLLVLGALGRHPALAYLYGVAAVQSAVMAVNSPTRSAAVPTLVGPDLLPAALALNQVMFNATLIVGPAFGGFLIAALGHPDAYAGLKWAYAVDVCSFAASIAASVMLSPLPPLGDDATSQHRPAWRSIAEGFRFLKGRQVLIATFLIDLDAMIFGMPRALFPVLALSTFRVGPTGLGLLTAAPAAGALIGALSAGWVGRARRQGLAVVWAVVLWGAAITAFGLSGAIFGLALAFLALAGAADVISAVFRSTILQLSVPDSLRGRLSAIHIMVVTGGPRLGDVEAGAMASLVSPWFSVVSGGLACMVGAVLLGSFVPSLARYRRDDPAEGPKGDGGRSRGPRMGR